MKGWKTDVMQASSSKRVEMAIVTSNKAAYVRNCHKKPKRTLVNDKTANSLGTYKDYKHV